MWDYGLGVKEVVIRSWFTSDSRANLETMMKELTVATDG